jgi:hypothetical protein
MRSCSLKRPARPTLPPTDPGRRPTRPALPSGRNSGRLRRRNSPLSLTQIRAAAAYSYCLCDTFARLRCICGMSYHDATSMSATGGGAGPPPMAAPSLSGIAPLLTLSLSLSIQATAMAHNKVEEVTTMAHVGRWRRWQRCTRGGGGTWPRRMMRQRCAATAPGRR